MSESKPAKVPEDKSRDVYYSINFVRETIALFKEADTDNNNAISFDELKAVVKKRDPKKTDAEIKKIFETLDFDDNKKITFDEFLIFDFALDAYGYDYSNAIII